MNTLCIRHLTKDYGNKRALSDVTLEIPQGMFGLLGPNGAGKTTLMRIVTSLLPPTTGELTYGDVRWHHAHEVRQIIGYLPQKFSLYKHIKVGEALLHVATLKGMRKGEARREVDGVLEQVNLTEQRDVKIGKLSGGMVRRVGIAQAMLGNPEIIVVDEPTAGLDPEERIRFRKYLRRLSKETVVIISTHIVEDVAATCEQTAVLVNGSVRICDSTEKVAQQAVGKVWEMQVAEEDFYELSEELNIVSSQKAAGHYRIRFLSETPPHGAEACQPHLEDGYLHLLQKS
ncbi:ABC transporter ATP-binding protein [Numidum massiliense]|uniref:ABC transporter ATP-binding protein n=1 Tax=Numidum massiliense TaxID=1522315 RepID=UPI0006D5726E|nr:ABC transporter ATP-binding protein [Numidum massiliense]